MFEIKKYKNYSFQTQHSLQIKVVELLPKLTFLGKNLDEALNLQKQHEELLLNIQVFYKTKNQISMWRNLYFSLF